jgi:DNA-binding response OmpR family regulator
MVLLSSSGTFWVMHVKLTNEPTPHNCTRLTDLDLPALGFSATEQADLERVRFEGFEADFGGRERFYDGRRIPIQEQPFQVLRALLELVTPEDLRSRLWPSDTHVGFDHNLNKAVAKQREALAKAGGKVPLIETLTRRGYRFIDLREPRNVLRR